MFVEDYFDATVSLIQLLENSIFSRKAYPCCWKSNGKFVVIMSDISTKVLHVIVDRTHQATTKIRLAVSRLQNWLATATFVMIDSDTILSFVFVASF
jgi:hypothetical protein